MIDPEPLPEVPGAEPAPAARSRNDSISPIVIIILLVFLTLQSSFLDLVSVSKHHTLVIKRSSVSDTGSGMPSDVETGLMSIDLAAKGTYLTFGLGSAPVHSKATSSRVRRTEPIVFDLSKSDAENRTKALDDAADLFRSYPDEPSLARRVILLRAETGSADPLGPITAPSHRRGVGPKVLMPLDAYNSLQHSSRALAAQGAGERATWQALFGSAKIAPDQVPALAARIRSIDNLRWWTNIALHQLYLRADEPALAARALAAAESEAGESVIPSMLLVLLALACGLIGLAFLIGFVARAMLCRMTGAASGPDSSSAPNAVQGASPNRAPTLFEAPARIQDSDRKLGAGDLANLFAFYLILMAGVQLFAGRAFHGALKRLLTQGSPSHQISMIIYAEAIVTLVCGLGVVAALFWLAKRRNASVADEIGLNRGSGPIANVILFGVIGWCIALPLLAGIGELAKLIFHNAPEPANPAIPLLMSTPGGAAAIVLYILVAVFAPFFEETVFRGLFYNAARLRVGVWPAIALTGIVFGASHSVGIAEQIPLAVLGCVLAWLAQTSKSLLPGMVLHCAQNTIVYATTLFAMMTIITYPVLQ